jgi:hypothetical protein
VEKEASCGCEQLKSDRAFIDFSHPIDGFSTLVLQ